jgi:hypothetical protein
MLVSMSEDRTVCILTDILDENGVVIPKGTLATIREVGDEWFIVDIHRDGWHPDALVPQKWTEPSS